MPPQIKDIKEIIGTDDFNWLVEDFKNKKSIPLVKVQLRMLLFRKGIDAHSIKVIRDEMEEWLKSNFSPQTQSDSGVTREGLGKSMTQNPYFVKIHIS